jgi:hypothetical protein
MKFDPDYRFQSALDAIKALGNPAFGEEAVEQKMVANAVPLTIEEPIQKRAEPVSPATGTAANIDTPLGIAGSAESRAPFDTDVFQPETFQHDPLDAAPFESEPIQPEFFDPQAVDVPANDEPDSMQSPQDGNAGERIPQPTQRIDLERIKEIIAKDTKKKAEVTARKNHAEQERAISQAVQDVRDSGLKNSEKTQQSKPYSMREKNSSGRTEQNALLARFRAMPPMFRPAVVGLGAAVLTIATVAAYQILPFGSDTGSSRGSAVATQASTADTGSNQGPDDGGQGPRFAEPFVFPHIPEGTYVGHIDDLIPGVRAPITLISKPAHRQIVVIVGIAGWSPALVSTTPEPSAPSSTLAIRSNGLILYVTGELSSDTIAGTFNNAVTGESGVWRVSKLS